MNQGVVHALVLQLIAAGIISIYVLDPTKEGTSQVSITDFVINWATIDQGDESTLAHMDLTYWSAFNYDV
jgi:hypothetical protein